MSGCMCISCTVIHLLIPIAAMHQGSMYCCCTIYYGHGGLHHVRCTIIVHWTAKVCTSQLYCMHVVDCFGLFSMLIKLIQWRPTSHVYCADSKWLNVLADFMTQFQPNKAFLCINMYLTRLPWIAKKAFSRVHIACHCGKEVPSRDRLLLDIDKVRCW